MLLYTSWVFCSQSSNDFTFVFQEGDLGQILVKKVSLVILSGNRKIPLKLLLRSFLGIEYNTCLPHLCSFGWSHWSVCAELQMEKEERVLLRNPPPSTLCYKHRGEQTGFLPS